MHRVARDLLGCTIVHGRTAGVIVETESYNGDDEACHGFGGRTQRNSVLFGPPGHAYVYLSYGVHSLLNFVAEREGRAAAVLIRALEPVRGLSLMRRRRGVEPLEGLCSGPGKLTQALDIGLDLNEALLNGGPLRVVSRARNGVTPRFVTTQRIGISKATDLPWRYCVTGSRFVSRPTPRAEKGSPRARAGAGPRRG
ncbi:hypothetical protein LCGC14_3128060 [marine sediment metagenome]|uniref:3-methyladenine DNA glycosylase n=1 Tax=marine sediment metagenome TaxID=412755 RepID=A0A0F8W0J7_9ZZZZ